MAFKYPEGTANAGLKPKQKEKTELIVDGGTDNNNKSVETLLEKYPLDKLVALISGLTPAEAYGRKTVNFKKTREKMVEAHHKRVAYNQTHACLGCPFECEQN